MEKGEMRVEANISVGGEGKLGTKVEVKNLNSFRSVERAIAFEIERQTALIEKGEAVVQETRGWDEVAQKTFSQRKKESSHDYRYFPDPDLPKLLLSDIEDFSLDALSAALPELPWKKRERYTSLDIKKEDVDQLTADFALSQFFDRVSSKLKTPALIKIAANFVLNDIAGTRKKDPSWLPKEDIFIEAITSYGSSGMSSAQVKSSLLSGSITEVIDTSALPKLAAEILAANPQAVAEYKKGKTASLQFLVGQGMRASKGSANPDALREALLALLG